MEDDKGTWRPASGEELGQIPEGAIGSIDAGTALLLPAHPQPNGRPDEVAIETRELPDGHRIVIAFTTPQKLAAALGDFQPWIALPAYRVQKMLPGLLVVVDPEVEMEDRPWNAETLAELGRSTEGSSNAA
jgi:hypothetical protein